jgi:diacylglycerol kinase family enzyme
MKMCPEASPDDGLFDVLVIGDVTKADLVRTLPKIYRALISHPKAELLRGATVSVEAEEALRSSSTVSSRERPRSASRSCRGRCACACRAS